MNEAMREEIKACGLRSAIRDRLNAMLLETRGRVGMTLYAETFRTLQNLCNECLDLLDETTALIVDELAEADQESKDDRRAVKPGIGENVEFDGLLSRWYTCVECRTPIDRGDRYCRTCGRMVRWD